MPHDRLRGMSKSRASLLSLSAITVCGVVGVIATFILNMFVLDQFDAYGEVKIPGTAELTLPAGDVPISFHSWASGKNGLPVPQLGLSIHPPEGVAGPAVHESIGATTTVNGDARIRVWVAHIPAAGRYTVETTGEVNGFVNPRLAFGHGSQYWYLTWLFAGLLGAAMVGWVLFGIWRTRATAPPPAPQSAFTPTSPVASYEPSADGIRIEQLKSLAALRDSGALTEAEFEAEKRRVLDGG